MKITKFEDRLIQKVQSQQFRDFLISSGWTLATTIRDILEVWRLENELELVLPIKESLKDYQESKSAAFMVLHDKYQLSISDLVFKMIGLKNDTIQIRVESDEIFSGTIKADAGVILFQEARAMMLAASCATNSKRKVFSGNHPVQTTCFMNDLRFGQTGIGSYIVNIVVPINECVDSVETIPPEIEEQPELEKDNIPYSRKVTNTLVQSLSALETTIKTYKENFEERVFQNSVDSGVSANLCEAISKMKGDSLASNIEVSINIDDSIESRKYSRFRFSSEDISIIEGAAKILAEETLSQEKYVFRGTVSRLSRDLDDTEGIIKLKGLLAGKMHSVKVQLNETDYSLAIEAHHGKKELKVIGFLARTGKTYSMTEVIKCEIVGDQESFF